MKLIAIYVVSFAVCVAVSALGYWLCGYSFAERCKALAEWYFATVFLSVMFATVPTLLYQAWEEIK